MIAKATIPRRSRRGPCGSAIPKGYTIDFIGDTLRVSGRSPRWADPEVVRELNLPPSPPQAPIGVLAEPLMRRI
jgi:hypothetical protein